MFSKISKLFHSENTVRTASVLLVVTLALSNVLGLFRDRLLAKYIEAGNLDIYFASFRIPDLIFNFLILGAIFSALVPVFSEYRAKGEMKEGWHIVNTVLNIGIIAMVISAVVVFFTMPYIIYLVVPNFSPDKMERTVQYSRILMLTPIFFSASYVISGVLNSYNRFVAYSLAPLIYNISIIVGIVLFARSAGVLGVVYFVVIGSALHLIIQLPSVIRLGYKFQFSFDYRNKAVQKILKLMLPRTIGLGANQILLLIYTSVASSLQSGSITAFNFANNIQTVPTVVFGGSMATAVFPALTMAAAKSEDDKFCSYLNKTIRTISYVLIPVSVAMILMRAQIIRLIFQTGYFDWDIIRPTSDTLGFFAVALLPQGLIPLFARAFYAVKNTKTPMYVGLIATLIGIIAAYLLAPLYHVQGLALAFSISSYVNAIILYLKLVKIPCYHPDKKILPSMIRILLVALVASIVMQFSKHLINKFVNIELFSGLIIQTILVLIISSITFFGMSILLKLEELKWALKRNVK